MSGIDPSPPAQPGLWACLAADLRRAQELSAAPHAPAKRGKLWMCALTLRFQPVLLCRLAQYFQAWGLAPIARLFALANLVIFGIEIAAKCRIGPGLYLPHTHGTVIGAYSLGRNATVFQGVTLGAQHMDFGFDPAARPVVGDDVTIGAGAKVLGGIQIGDSSAIGANAVVLESIPARAVAVGVPARVVKLMP